MLKDGKIELYRYLYDLRNYDRIAGKDQLLRQEENLRQLLKHAGQNSRFYTELFQEYDVIPDARRDPFEQISKLPIQTKSILNENRTAIIASNIPSKHLMQDSTGGSTGTPLIFYRDKHCILKRRAQELFFDKWMDCRIGDKVALFVAARHHPKGLKGFKSRFRNATAARLLAFDPFKTDEMYLKSFYSTLRKFSPDIIKCFPNSLYIFARFLKEKGLVDIRPRAVSCTGETLHHYQRELFEEVFQCPVYEKYGSFEIGVAACECSQHNGMHMFQDGVYFEFVNQNGKHAEPGEMAQLIVTDLYNYGFPLIRYQIGDIGAFSASTCSCGSKLPLMSKLFGRDRDILVDDHGRPRPGYLFVEVFNKNHIPGTFQVIQEDSDHVLIKAVKAKEYTKTHEELILKSFRGLLGQGVEINFIYLSEIPREPSGKYKWVHSKLNMFNENS
jgi:phenylacetate-CoA ligase